MKNQPAFRQARPGAFTLVEMLVVIAIIGILAGLIVSLSGIAAAKMRRAKAEAARGALVTAIQSYKNKKGFYPPDSPLADANTSPAGYGVTNQLFYELTGTQLTNSGGQNAYKSFVNRDQLTANQITAIFGVAGFINSSPDTNELQNFVGAVAKSGMTASFNSGGATFTIFGISMSGSLSNQLTSADGKIINPWHYVSTNPTNNPDSYDLWMDVLYNGRTNRISNWSKDPQPIGP